ncbi:MAG: hypothetical protein ABIJ31_10590 [Pseudomonadota bacterium]
MDKKKLAAAIAAVFAYIKTSEEAFAQHAFQAGTAGQDLAVLHQAKSQPCNTWGITGRQNQMQANSMMQMRMFK